MRTALSPEQQRESGTRHIDGSPATLRHTGVFPSEHARAALISLYDAKLAQWPIPFEEFDVPSRYGRTHVVAAGEVGAPPLVLVHMGVFPSFMWGSIIEPLAARYRTYALDTIGDVGKSELDDPKRFPKSGQEFSAWLCDVCDELDLLAPRLVAGSYGGWIALNHAACAPARVRRLALLVPMGLPSWSHTLRVLFRMSTFALRPMASRERFLSWLMGDTPAARREAEDWMTAILDERPTPKLGAPLPIPATTLELIRTPTLIVLGGRDPLIGNAERAARRAVKHIVEVDVEILPNGSHALHVEEPRRVATRIVDFMEW
jgi:pimeloyl-ACP methyl ester carboxylesterase